MNETKKEPKFIYRCEHCDLILFKKPYHKKMECPFCHQILNIITIDENAVLISFNNSIDNLIKEIEQLGKTLDNLTDNERNQLSDKLEILYNHLEFLQDNFPK